MPLSINANSPGLLPIQGRAERLSKFSAVPERPGITASAADDVDPEQSTANSNRRFDVFRVVAETADADGSSFRDNSAALQDLPYSVRNAVLSYQVTSRSSQLPVPGAELLVGIDTYA